MSQILIETYQNCLKLDKNLQKSDRNCKTSMKIPKLRSILTQNSDQFAQNSDITTPWGRTVSRRGVQK